MILSMTGYGRAENQWKEKKIVIELRSLNSKTMDLSVRIAPAIRYKELEIRNIVSQKLERGKVDLSISYQDINTGSQTHYTPINKEAFGYYYRELQALQGELGIAPKDMAEAILRLPDVMRSTEEESNASEEEWAVVEKTLGEAIEAFRQFRIQEGESLEKMFREKLDQIEGLLAEVEPYEKSRVEKIKQHLMQNLEKLSEEQKRQIDGNRLEQEMIYYLEKLDINEEKVRLTNHLKYFRETLDGDGSGVGKKLGFIAQEMGREINTLGSKSNQSEMQIIVVKMKDVLEQIKEQVLNVL